MGTLAANTSLGNDGFQENNPEYAGLFSYLEGKGGSGEERIVESLVAADVNMEDKDEYGSWMKSNIAFMSRIDYEKGDSLEENLGAGAGGAVVSGDQKIDFSPLASLQGNSFVATANYCNEDDEDLRYGIVKYVVRSGDTLGTIAYSFGISTSTLFWANKDNLKNSDYIKPGMELIVLPISGALHKVEEIDTIEKIAAKYKTDEELIIRFVGLPADGNLESKIGRNIIVPSGDLPAPPSSVRETINQRSVASVSKYRYVSATNQKGHRFPWGYCTWYVATKRHVPWGGHAKSWLANAAAYGYKVDKTPSKGAIVVTTEHRWYGHVAYVEAVNGNVMTISEMNYVGFGIRSVRTLSVNSRVIRGYVH